MKVENSYDLIVLGAGSGGLAAAKRASSYGAKVAIVEADRVGGTCVIRGCVPKKLLVYGSLYREYYNNANSYGVKFGGFSIDPQILLENVRAEVDRLNKLHIDFLDKSGVDLVEGWGRLSSRNSVSVISTQNNQVLREIKAKRILIAVGSSPYVPSIPGSDLAWVSDDVFSQNRLPNHIVVVGGGYIACEFACIFNGLGIKVTQLVRSNSLLRGFDKELSFALQKGMIENGINICLGQSATDISGCIGDLTVKTTNDTYIPCGACLMATGRRPKLDKLGLEEIGIKTNNNAVTVDDEMRTSKSNIFAIGDVTDLVNLTPVAIEQGRSFADKLYGNDIRKIDYDLIPKAVFSNPEIASVGVSEEQAIQIHGPNNIQIYKSKFKPMSKALPKSGSPCLLKLVVYSGNQKVIGCHMLGENAAEIVQMAAIAIVMGATKSNFDRTMALHPTIAEEFVTMR